MIALWRPTDGFSEYEWFALVDDGEVVAGEFVPSPGVDLEDERVLLDRYTGPGVIASRVGDQGVLEGARRTSGAGGDEAPRTVSSEPYECTVCGTTVRCESGDGETRRWMACADCGKNRFFELTG